ncbi:MAG: response regulator transcription factor [Phormidesmis sp.]
MKILIVEDDTRIATPLAKDLRHQHHSVDIACDGMEGWNYAQATDYELILLDLMLPQLDGISLCKKLRSAGCQSNILMLTARDTTSEKVIGLDAGADDYLVKPFKLEELAARIRALQRRCREFTPAVLQYGDLKLDPASQLVVYCKQPLSLTPKEYLLLEYFMRHPAKVLSRSALLDRLWEFDQESGEGTIKTHLTNLRTKLKAAGSPKEFIETVYGMGYRLMSMTDV